MSELTPGTHVVVKYGALMRLYGTDTESYSMETYHTGMVIQNSYRLSGEGDAIYMVLLSKPCRIYEIEECYLHHPDHIENPGRLFGRLSG